VPAAAPTAAFLRNDLRCIHPPGIQVESFLETTRGRAIGEREF
jgi:hypothetical protein